MHASIPAMTYILENRNLFIKPYIPLMAQDDIDFLWSCFILVHAGQITNEDGTACGFLHFNPRENVTDCQESPLLCSFFLTLAYLVINAVPPKLG
jgi:hypothetical protein